MIHKYTQGLSQEPHRNSPDAYFTAHKGMI